MKQKPNSLHVTSHIRLLTHHTPLDTAVALTSDATKDEYQELIKCPKNKLMHTEISSKVTENNGVP
jgi:hypothetical protein